jgi:hypothetical protein
MLTERLLAGDRMDTKETLLEMYKLNYDYHNVKEQMFWLAATFYLGFAAGLTAWTTASPKFIQDHRLLVLIFSIGVLSFTELFVLVQNWYKARSVFIDGLLCDLLRRFDPGMKIPKYWEICSAVQSRQGTPGFKRMSIFFKNGWSGVLVMAIMLVFGIAQIATVSLVRS